MTAEQRSRHLPTAALRLSTAAAGAAADSTVVIVDDEPTNVALLERLLAAAGVVRVHGFTDPRQALAYCTGSFPDLVLLDLHMPDLDGFAFMEALQGLVPEGGFLPVLVLTADVTTEVKERALATGAKDFLTKPFDRTEVLLRVSNLLETRALYGRLEITTERLRSSLEDLSTFSHAMAHDLRNPLATILMWTSVAPSTAGPDDRAEPVLQMVDRIREVAVYANGLIAHLLRYAELDRLPAPAEPVDLNLVVSKAVAGLEAAVMQSGAVIQSRNLPTVVADFTGLEMVMENLISNAITYRRDVPLRVVIEASAAGDTWEIRCRDNGTGIPADLGDAIFQPFVRGDPSKSGSGLGLATCRRIIERLGGRLWIDESSETGTCIAFTLLRHAPGSAQAPGPRGETAR
jgi:signal transduction histidine kinase